MLHYPRSLLGFRVTVLTNVFEPSGSLLVNSVLRELWKYSVVFNGRPGLEPRAKERERIGNYTLIYTSPRQNPLHSPRVFLVKINRHNILLFIDFTHSNLRHINWLYGFLYDSIKCSICPKSTSRLREFGLPRSGTTLFASFSGKRRILLDQLTLEGFN
jgi:hypothetical protein